MSDITPIDEKAPSEGDVSVRSLRGDSFIAQTSRQKKYKYSVSTAALDLDGKGYLNEVELLCRKFDKSGTGKFSINDVKLIAATLHETEKKHKKLLQRTFFIVAFFVALSAVFLGLMVTANEYSKESHIKTQNGTSSLVDLKGQAVETDRPESLVTIWALPLLSSRTLARMHHLSVYLGNGRKATYEIASAETYFGRARLLTTDGSRIDISMSDMQANITSHGEFHTIQASEEQRVTPWVFPGTKVTGDLGASYYTYDNRKPVKRSSNGRMLSEARSKDSAGSIIGSVGSLQLKDIDDCELVTTSGLPSCVDSCTAACESDCNNDVAACAKRCSTTDCSADDKAEFDKYIKEWNKISALFSEKRRDLAVDHEGIVSNKDRKLVVDYGCCSTNVFFLLGWVSDTADCSTDTSDHNGEHLSSQCIDHDTCLSRCTKDNKGADNKEARCKCYGGCDVKLHDSADKGKCRGWGWLWCRTVTFAVRKVMKKQPNSKPDRCH